jgi:kynurenine formamidase
MLGGRSRLRTLPLGLLLFQLHVEQAAGGALERAMVGKSTIVDLTHAVSEHGGSPSGHERPKHEGQDDEDRDAGSQRVPASGDLGTHLEAPVADARGQATVARIPARELLVHAVTVDIAGRVAGNPDYRATVEDLQAWEQRHGRIPRGSVVLLHTGWARRWNDRTRYLNLDGRGIPHVPGFSPAAMAFLANQREVRGVGLDAFIPQTSPGSAGDGVRPLHLTGKWRLVNLTNLDLLPAKGAKLVIAPLRLEAESAPARVIAILP